MLDLNLHVARRRRIQHDIRSGSRPIESCCHPLAPSCTGRAIDISTPHSLSAESRARERTLNKSSLANRIRRVDRVASSISDRFRLGHSVSARREQRQVRAFSLAAGARSEAHPRHYDPFVREIVAASARYFLSLPEDSASG